MKKGALIFCLFISLAFVSTASALIITDISIQSSTPDHSGYRWDTTPDNFASPIGVSPDQSTLINNTLTSAIPSPGYNLIEGGIVYLYTESFYNLPGTYNDLFTNESYQMIITADGNDYRVNFSFDAAGNFILGDSTAPFTLSFLGLGGDLVGPRNDSSGFNGIALNSVPDAVYQLTAQAVPEPATLLLLGFGLVGLGAVGRKRLIG